VSILSRKRVQVRNDLIPLNNSISIKEQATKRNLCSAVNGIDDASEKWKITVATPPMTVEVLPPRPLLPKKNHVEPLQQTTISLAPSLVCHLPPLNNLQLLPQTDHLQVNSQDPIPRLPLHLDTLPSLNRSTTPSSHRYVSRLRFNHYIIQI